MLLTYFVFVKLFRCFTCTFGWRNAVTCSKVLTCEIKKAKSVIMTSNVHCLWPSTTRTSHQVFLGRLFCLVLSASIIVHVSPKQYHPFIQHVQSILLLLSWSQDSLVPVPTILWCLDFFFCLSNLHQFTAFMLFEFTHLSHLYVTLTSTPKFRTPRPRYGVVNPWAPSPVHGFAWVLEPVKPPPVVVLAIVPNLAILCGKLSEPACMGTRPLWFGYSINRVKTFPSPQWLIRLWRIWWLCKLLDSQKSHS